MTNQRHVPRKPYAMQCSGLRGVSAMVHRANVVCGGKEDREHSKQLVIRGRISLAYRYLRIN